MAKQATTFEERLQRIAVRGIVCPKCGAQAYEHCKGERNNKRYQSHQERWDAYRERERAKEEK
jgi:hypothetical protein